MSKPARNSTTDDKNTQQAPQCHVTDKAPRWALAAAAGDNTFTLCTEWDTIATSK